MMKTRQDRSTMTQDRQRSTSRLIENSFLTLLICSAIVPICLLIYYLFLHWKAIFIFTILITIGIYLSQLDNSLGQFVLCSYVTLAIHTLFVFHIWFIIVILFILLWLYFNPNHIKDLKRHKNYLLIWLMICSLLHSVYLITVYILYPIVLQIYK